MRKVRSNTLTLKIDGTRVPAEQFQKAVEGFLGLLRNVSDEMFGAKGAVTWVVDVEPGSVVLNADPDSTIGSPKQLGGLTRVIRSGIASLERSDERPRFFSDAALWHAREMASAVNDLDHRINRLVVKANGKSTRVSRHTVANVDGILSTSRTEEGSVEGRVSVLSDRRRFEVQVDDVLTGSSVKCIADKKLQDKLISAFRRRVVVSGKVHYRKDGLPISIDVVEIRVLGGSKLPKFEDVRGILRR